MFEVFVDDFISLCIPRCQADLDHVANSLLHAIHDVFPAEDNDKNDPASLKKLIKGDGQWAII